MNSIDRESTIIDYLNGHLQADEELAFEQSMQDDKQLADDVAQAKMLKQMVSDKEPSMADPSFAEFSSQLDSSAPWYAKWYNWVPVPAAALAVFLVVTPQTSVNEFETLTDAQQTYAQPSVRLIGDANTDLLQLADEYELTILKRYSGTNAIDATHSENLPFVMQKLEQDPRILIVKPLGE